MNSLLKPNSKIGVFAPSSYVEAGDIDAAKALMESKGYEAFVHQQTFARHHQSAGTHDDKIAALHDLYRDSSIDVIWAAGGGNRALHILDRLDYDLIRANPKPMIGFSDVTALLNAISVKTDIVNIHGPVFKNLPKHEELDVLLSGDYTMPLDGCAVIRGGSATGKLFGGNLSVFQYLPEMLGNNFLDGAILVLEDCNEELSRIDRMFWHLKNCGVFERIGGLILGEFCDLADSARPFGFSLEEIVREHSAGCEIPVFMNAPFGHGARLHPLPIGSTVQLNDDFLRIV